MHFSSTLLLTKLMFFTAIMMKLSDVSVGAIMHWNCVHWLWPCLPVDGDGCSSGLSHCGNMVGDKDGTEEGRTKLVTNSLREKH